MALLEPTAAGFAAGVPAVRTPFFGHQPFWGAQVHALGLGPQPIPRRKLTADRLAAAIDRAVSDANMHARAAELGARVRSEDGIANAVALIEQASQHT